MARHRVLLVEDEEDIQELVRYNLGRDGYAVEAVTSGEAALASARQAPPDLILLDIMLPGIDGLEVCRLLKANPKTNPVPILMLTARGEEVDIVTGLEVGADDYLPKPFSPKVLTARVRAVLRRATAAVADAQTTIRLHDLVIDPGRHEVTVGGAAVDLTFTEFRILHLLARRPGWVFTRAQVIEEVRGEEYPVTDRSVDVHMVALRRKLGENGKYVETVRGVGYRFRD
ncbi:MAG: response regulator transcription factor [Fimbriimonadaceae bacterium]|nr:response regulator transcription factor [Fimbriimonadaceae bacterium]